MAEASSSSSKTSSPTCQALSLHCFTSTKEQILTPAEIIFFGVPGTDPAALAAAAAARQRGEETNTQLKSIEAEVLLD